MISLKRQNEPEILASKKQQWVQKYEEKLKVNSGARPLSAQYGHAQILERLRAISHTKCFYCERALTRESEQVDHYVEIKDTANITEQATRAFEWDNLYLSCKDCNDLKFTNQDIPVTQCIDPCSDFDPLVHFRFDTETMQGLTTVGDKTVTKYKLQEPRKRLDLVFERIQYISQFRNELERIYQLQIQEGRKKFTVEEIEMLLAYRSPAHPFSLMFHYYLSKLGL